MTLVSNMTGYWVNYTGNYHEYKDNNITIA